MTTTATQPDSLSPPAGDGIQPAGSIHINEDVVAKLAAHAAAEHPDIGGPAHGLRQLTGAAVLGSKADLSRRPKASAHLDGDQAHIDLVVSVRWPAALPQVTAALREHVRARLEQLTGLRIGTVNIDIADLVAGDRGARVH
ncbi:hypothetical protein CS0771_64320 [Catellatospora sp. IY07-71]|uniref:Asp23/Gls24 family envelope stress response protein n=1 Tax=Catellatospora sp. IY07-71 TaxID=2728827 RepID=UPI001BB38274|nr:Asp23/Gls24 family envelope stress response protein [Catellatospora sp. IY07-71]BCJ76888.1 hypothetical protein CS0771_64320 [Catellatospora sp. IY07-71]